MKLHVQIAGHGPDLVLLHGWGLNASIWNALAESLHANHRVHLIDLPGHGHSRWGPGSPTDLEGLVRIVAPYVPRQAIVLGWSLGAMVAMQLAARAPQNVGALILVAATPKFVREDDWVDGMTTKALANFAQRLHNDWQATIQEFLALQVRGEEKELAALRTLRQKLLERGLPQLAALEAGLGILRAADLRPLLPQIRQPTLVIGGEYDRVTSPAASRYLADQLADARLHVVNRAGHAPFISHAGEFASIVSEFLTSLHSPAKAASTR